MLQQSNYVEELIFCPQCGQLSFHIIEFEKQIDKKINQKVVEESQQEGLDGKKVKSIKIIGYSEIYLISQIIVCTSCKYVSLRNIELNKESDIPEKIYIIPNRIDRTIKKEYKDILPYEIYSLYEEAINTYNSAFNFSSGASLRSLLERICKNRGHKATVLQRLKKQYCQDKNKTEIELTENELEFLEIRSNLSKHRTYALNNK